MSTIKVINAIHPTGSTTNLVLDNAGNVAVGGTALTVNGVAVPAVAPGTAGNVLTSNGTAWTSAAATGISTGSIITYGSSSTPSGYLPCDGSTYTKSSYTALSTVLGSIMANTFTRTATASNNYARVAVANGKVFIVGAYSISAGSGSNGGYYSADNGVTWTTITATIGGNVAWNGTRYVAGGGFVGGCCGFPPGIWHSTNGTTWTNVTTNVNYSATGPAWTGSRFVVLNYTTTPTSYSTDGLTWTAGGALPASFYAQDVAYGNSTLVAIGRTSSSGTGTAKIATSPDGTTWTSRTPHANMLGLAGITFQNSQFIVTDATNNIFTSSDGITWTQKYSYSATTSPFSNAGASPVNRVAYNAADARYYFASSYSTDLITWYRVPYSQVYASTIGQMGECASDGTRLYNTYGAVYNPLPYNTSTQFIVPNFAITVTAGAYYYIKT